MECHEGFERCLFWIIEEKGHQPYVCISDHFVDAVKSGHLQVRPRVVEVHLWRRVCFLGSHGYNLVKL